VNTEQNAAYAQKLLQHIGRHLLDGQWCDTVIVTDDGRLSAHSVVLAAASPVFKAALRVTDRPREHVVVLPGIKSSLMKTILQFVYTGEIVPLPKDTATFLSLLLDLQLVRLELVENRLSFFCLFYLQSAYHPLPSVVFLPHNAMQIAVLTQQVVHLSVCDLKYRGHRLEYSENNVTAD